MNCIDFENAVQESLDARQTALPQHLQAHHDACGDCRAFYAGQLALISACAALPSPVVPPEILANALDQLALVDHKSPHSRLASTASVARGRMAGTLCSAAALFVLALVLLRAPPAPQSNVTQNTVPSGSVETEIVSETLSGLFQGMSSDYTDLTWGTRQALRSIGELPRSTSLMRDLPPVDLEKVEQTREWQRWDRPVSDRVGQAFHFLWDALPQPPPQSS